jgi:hypothetical protein
MSAEESISKTGSSATLRFSLEWSRDDDGWVATCSALASLSFIAVTPNIALDGLISLIKDIEGTDTLVDRLVTDTKERCSLDQILELLESPHIPPKSKEHAPSTPAT